MIIRKAIQQDLQGIANVLRAFRADPIAPKFTQVAEDTRSGEIFILKSLPHTFVAVEDSEVVGILMSHIGASPANPNAKFIEESYWYVLSKYRAGSAGYRLFNAWKEYALELKDAGKIRSILMHTMAGSPVDMTRHGCRALQTTYEVIE